ncbi:hypothetical protein [Cystobacter fuscus]|uniref:hypothetical protein n=1 Tax=Cystobacter fuscus TaxID=43 RepID=UPI0012FD481F|nr:hypothetical protein [Cystobacter fuscus]
MQPQIESLGSLMLGFLKDAHSSHTEASCQAVAMDQEGIALQGGLIEAPKPPPIKQNSSALTEALRTFFQRAPQSGEPIRMIEFRFRRSGAGWTYQVALETLAAHEALVQERTALDQEVAKAMIAAAGANWNKVVFERRLPTPAKLVAFLDRERRELAVTPELEALLQRAFRLYDRHGRELRWPLWRVKGDRNTFEVETQFLYG